MPPSLPRPLVTRRRPSTYVSAFGTRLSSDFPPFTTITEEEEEEALKTASDSTMADSLLSDLEALGEEVPEELLKELEREVERNAKANR